MSFGNRLNRVSKLMQDIAGMNCPKCHGVNGKAASARVFYQAASDAMPVLQPSAAAIFDRHGRCTACGAESLDIVFTALGASV